MALIPSKFSGYSRDGIRKYNILNIGGGSSSTNVNLTDEQKELLRLQTGQLRDVFMPAYTNTVGGARDLYNQTSPYTTQSALDAFNQFGDVASESFGQASSAYKQGMEGLKNLFDPEYEKNQINAALQEGRETSRELLGGQNAMYGAAGGLGSLRMALADENLSSLNAQRQATAAAGAQAGVRKDRMTAANYMFGAGRDLYGIGGNAATSRINASRAPMGGYEDLARIIFGVPQGATTPNFSGTQGSSTSGSGFGFGIGGGSGSDINIKENIQKIGVLDNGINLYKYEYKTPYKDTWGHGPQIGVMAQEVEKVIPEAVGTHPDGYKTVNYAMVM